MFADILKKINLDKKNTRYKNYVKLCNDSIILATKMIKKQKVKNIKNKTRHYQNITSKKLTERNIDSLKYIIDYFREYRSWLMQIKKFKFDKF